MSEFRFNEARMRELQHGRFGSVGRFMERTGVRIESEAKKIATEERLVRTGRYRASLTWHWAPGATLRIEVGSAVPHARLIEFGSPPHQILPRRPKFALWWDRPNDRGWVVLDRPVGRVNHPGTRPYRVIGRAIERVLARSQGGTP